MRGEKVCLTTFYWLESAYLNSDENHFLTSKDNLVIFYVFLLVTTVCSVFKPSLMRLRYIILLVLFILNVSNIRMFAQEKDNTAKLPVQMAIEPSAKLSMGSSELNFSIFKMVGNKKELAPSTVDSIWLNYSSVIQNNTTNTISASLATGDLPAEVAIKLNVSSDAGAGYGQVGKPTMPVYLSTYPQSIITDIGSCYTGMGNNKGHLLSFTWELNKGYDLDVLKYEQISSLRIRVIYTINSDE